MKERVNKPTYTHAPTLLECATYYECQCHDYIISDWQSDRKSLSNIGNNLLCHQIHVHVINQFHTTCTK